ncbi:hypothetical protein PQE66_gp001 [Bacillus phage PBC2]|uniref:Uncharacterized protein n=1 Tax=Bacillus phage PBC2 TaxID=1675029 RepID=A0A218KBP5_9CAUD|nr:hypothetical protein PQE66_gp001 [Bacillus phage PBC2]AKQ08316.1 hypothetical protein PBC2_001 [Bacillus phage PBC2]
MFQFNGIGFLEDKEVIGAIGAVDWMKETVTIVTEEDEKVEGSLHELVLLQYIGEFGENNLFNHDVVVTTTANKQDRFEIELQQNGMIVLHQLDVNLERVKTGKEMTVEHLQTLVNFLELEDSIYVLKTKLESISTDFTVKMVRDISGEEPMYFYACNNLEEEVIDLIHLVFDTNGGFDNAKYSRITLPYQGYIETVERGILEEVTLEQLIQEGLGKVEESKNVPNDEPSEAVKDNSCECGKDKLDCDCDLW